MKATGIILIVLGLVMTVYTTFSFFKEDKILDLGRVEITKDKKQSVSWSPIVGIIMLAAGSIILWKSPKK